MKEFISIIIFVLSIFFLVSLMRCLFLKNIVLFRLLKELHPEKFKGLNSYWQLMWLPNYFRIGVENIFWMSIPFYYSKINKKNTSQSVIIHHDRLILVNKKILKYMLLYICSIVLL